MRLTQCLRVVVPFLTGAGSSSCLLGGDEDESCPQETSAYGSLNDNANPLSAFKDVTIPKDAIGVATTDGACSTCASGHLSAEWSDNSSYDFDDVTFSWRAICTETGSEFQRGYNSFPTQDGMLSVTTMVHSLDYFDACPSGRVDYGAWFYNNWQPFSDIEMTITCPQ